MAARKPKVVERPTEETFEFKDRTYILKGDSTPITYAIRSKHAPSKPLLYFDGEKNRALRYCDNQSSVFLDEQDGYAVTTQIVMDNGKLIVPKENVELQKFLSIYHPDNGKVFYEFNPEQKAQKDYDEELVVLEAQIQVKDMPIEDLEAVGRVIFKNKVDRLTSSELRRDLIVYARKNPKEFMALIDDDIVKFRNIAVRAVDMGIIKISKDGRNVSWANEGGKILTVPFGENVYSALASFFITDEGMDVISKISEQL